MIVTLTANPSIDRTVQLEQRLERGSVLRAHSTRSDPGGKGVNVGACSRRSRPRRARGAAGDRGVGGTLCSRRSQPVGFPTSASPQRVRLAPTSPSRNRTGPRRRSTNRAQRCPVRRSTPLAQELIARADTALWFALSGSLPPGVPLGWYGELVAALRDHPCKVAVDTSDAPLTALAEGFPGSAPDLLKPNGEELAQLTGVDGHVLERAAENGDPGPAITAAQRLVDRGVGSVLATLGAAVPSSSRPTARGSPPLPRLSQSVPSAQAIRRWPATSSPKRAAARNPSGYVTRSPTEAPLPPFPAQPFPHPNRSIWQRFRYLQQMPPLPSPSPPNSPDALRNLTCPIPPQPAVPARRSSVPN